MTAAAAANYGSALPQRVPVAIGAAFLGILLVLRRRPRVAHDEVGDADDGAEAVAEGPSPNPGPTVTGRNVRTQLLALAASIATAERQLEAHENRLTSLSGRQSLLHVEARDGLVDVDARLQRLEARMTETEELTQMIRTHHLEILRRLNESLADHREALVGLADAAAE